MKLKQYLRKIFPSFFHSNLALDGNLPSLVNAIKSHTGSDGFYHNITLTGNITSWNVFGRRLNATHTDPFAYEKLLSEFTQLIEKQYPGLTPYRNQKILDIGPAEGWYVFKLLSLGAQSVTYIQPSNLALTKRLNLIAKYKRLSNQIISIDGFFPEAFGAKQSHNSFDIVLCLGVVYHALDVNAFMEELSKFRCPILLETSHSIKPDLEPFKPENHKDGHLSSRSQSRPVLVDIGYILDRISSTHNIHPLHQYNQRCLTPGYLADYNYGSPPDDSYLDRNYTRSAYMLSPKE